MQNIELNFYTKDNKTAKMEFVNIIPNETKTVIENISLVNEDNSNVYKFEGVYLSNSRIKYKYIGKIQRGIESNFLSLEFENI